jgi:proteasome lid subunit RPN8/RPN11
MDFYRLADFLEQINQMFNKKIKDSIREACLKDDAQEACGFIVFKNDFMCIPCKNIAPDPINFFKISSIDFLKTKYIYNKIYYIYHSHISENCEFSELDKACSESLMIPIILHNIKKNIFKVYESTNLKKSTPTIDFACNSLG